MDHSIQQKSVFLLVPLVEEVHNARFGALCRSEEHAKCHIVTFKHPTEDLSPLPASSGSDFLNLREISPHQQPEPKINFLGAMHDHLKAHNVVIMDYQDLAKHHYPVGFALGQLLDLQSTSLSSRCAFSIFLPIDRHGQVEKLLTEFIQDRKRRKRKRSDMEAPSVRFLTFDLLKAHPLYRSDESVFELSRTTDSMGFPRSPLHQIKEYLHPAHPFAEIQLHALQPEGVTITQSHLQFATPPPHHYPQRTSRQSPSRCLDSTSSSHKTPEPKPGRRSIFKKYPRVFEDLKKCVTRLYESGEGYKLDNHYFDSEVRRLGAEHYPDSLELKDMNSSWYTLDKFRREHDFPRLRHPENVLCISDRPSSAAANDIKLETLEEQVQRPA